MEDEKTIGEKAAEKALAAQGIGVKTEEPVKTEENQGVIALAALATVGAIFLLKRINEKKEAEAQARLAALAVEEAARQDAFWSGGSRSNNTGVKPAFADSKSGSGSGSPIPGMA